MSYETGTSTGANDLIDKLRVFLLADSWTVNLWADDGTGKRLHVQKTAGDSTVMYFNFRSAVNEKGSTITGDNVNSEGYGNVTGILVNGSTGYDVGESWDKQPGYGQNAASQSYACAISPVSLTAIPSYYFFSVNDTVSIVVEITSGKFQFMSFGLLEKQGTFTGGQFFTASMSSGEPAKDWTGYDYKNQYVPRYLSLSGYAGYDLVQGAVYVNADSVASWRRCSETAEYPIAFSCVSGQRATPNTSFGTYSKRAFCSMFYAKSPSAYNAMAAMAPAYVFLKRTDLNYSLIGWPSGVRCLNVTQYDPGQELTYGDETWLVFHNNGINDTPVNLYAGFAFKKVV